VARSEVLSRARGSLSRLNFVLARGSGNSLASPRARRYDDGMNYPKPAWLTWRLLSLLAMFLTLTVSGILCLFIKTPNVADGGATNFIEPYLPLYPFLLTVFLLVSVLSIREFRSIFVCEDEDRLDPLPSRGELGLLLMLKRRGSQFRTSWLTQKLASKATHRVAGLTTQIQSRRSPASSPERALDRLLRLKQAGAWNP
jgi:hypothetical protein